jgi:hypothetical protein
LHGIDPGRLAERAGRFGLHLVAHHVVAVVRGDSASTDADDHTRQLAEALRSRVGVTGVLVTTKEGPLVCVVQRGDRRPRRHGAVTVAGRPRRRAPAARHAHRVLPPPATPRRRPATDAGHRYTLETAVLGARMLSWPQPA